MPKNDKKGGDKSGAKGKGSEKEVGGKTKGAQSINVRHILVCVSIYICSHALVGGVFVFMG